MSQSTIDIDVNSIKRHAEKTGKCGDALFWWQLGGDLYIEGQGEIYSEAFKGNDSIRRVKIAPGCTGIGDFAFLYCELESVELPDGLEYIGTLAFFCKRVAAADADADHSGQRNVNWI